MSDANATTTTTTTTSTTAAATTTTSDQPPRFEVKKWNAVALWSWDIQVDTCAICRMHLMDLCVECQTNNPNADANLCGCSFGACGHAFHFHCISKWLKTRAVCPLDNREWEFVRHGI